MPAVGALAVRCLDPKSKDRPTMTQVCKELQSLWLSLDTTFNFSDQVLPGSHLLGSLHTDAALQMCKCLWHLGAVGSIYGGYKVCHQCTCVECLDCRETKYLRPCHSWVEQSFLFQTTSHTSLIWNLD